MSIKIYDPQYGSKLTNTIIELEKLRDKRIGGPVPPYIFFQVKNIFQMLESLGSARIEGNNTTLAEFVERVIENRSRKNMAKVEQLNEIDNIEKAIDFIEETVTKNTKFDRALISQIHKILVKGLTLPPDGEGSRYPGKFRPIAVSIKNSKHIPPAPEKILEHFDELMEFVNEKHEIQYHLLAVAISHHKLAWIHPFDNGNGRMVRMFTYAILIKQGFKVKSGRILNPTAVFCMDRNKYYDMLASADTETREGILRWCEYVLEGLRTEIEKVDSLLDLKYITRVILIPMLAFALDRGHINVREYHILNAVVRSRKMQIRSADLEDIIGEESAVQRSRILKKLKDKDMLIPLKENGRIYTIGFSNNYLLRGMTHVLRENGFIPESLDKKA